ncbi:TetR/AcrR family transcriptional regulator [Dactylosporangium sp. CS-033363]|uniref:TetR/AcrR family transcriptional regulator n=1 Tax=Dactylosporangium sp. CS-033363 TaxID=3239935 RepID=UPI003D8C4A9B
MTGPAEDDAPLLTLMPDRLGLPRGRSALPESEVAASQRGRILQAVTEEVAARGYAATTVQHVISRARVSRTAFYDQFADKQDAFAHAHLEASEQLLDLIRQRVAACADEDWRRRLRVGVEAYLAGFEGAPSYAVSFMVELRGAGPRLLDQRDRIVDRHARNFSRLAEAAAAEDPGVRRPAKLEVIGVIGAADELATRAIRATEPGSAPRLGRLVAPIVAIYEAVLLQS